MKRAIRHKGRRIRWLLLPGPGNCMQIKCSGGMENLSVWTRSSTKQKDTEAQNQGFLPEKDEEKRAGENDEKAVSGRLQ